MFDPASLLNGSEGKTTGAAFIVGGEGEAPSEADISAMLDALFNPPKFMPRADTPQAAIQASLSLTLINVDNDLKNVLSRLDDAKQGLLVAMQLAQHHEDETAPIFTGHIERLHDAINTVGQFATQELEKPLKVFVDEMIALNGCGNPDCAACNGEADQEEATQE